MAMTQIRIHSSVVDFKTAEKAGLRAVRVIPNRQGTRVERTARGNAFSAGRSVLKSMAGEWICFIAIALVEAAMGIKPHQAPPGKE